MRNKKTYQLLLVLVLCIVGSVGNVSAQMSLVDSLKNQIEIRPDDTLKIDQMSTLGFELIRSSPLESLMALHGAVQLSVDLGDRKREGAGYRDLANYHSSHGNKDSSYLYYERAIKLLEEIKAYDKLASAYSNRGTTQSRFSEYDNALESFTKSKEIGELNADSIRIAVSYSKLALTKYYMGRYDEAIALYLEAIALQEIIGDTASLIVSLSNFAQVKSQIGLYEEAVDIFKKVLKWKGKDAPPRFKGSVTNNIGSMHQSLGNMDSALHYYKIAYEILKEASLKRYYAAPAVNIGLILLDKKQYDEAKDFLLESIALRQEMGELDGLSGSYIVMAQYYYEIENYTQSIKYATKGLKLGQEIESLARQRRALYRLYLTYKKIGQNKKALKVLREETVIRDSMFNSESQRTIADLESRYESEKTDREILLLQKEQELTEAAVDKEEALLVRKQAEGLERESEVKMMILIAVLIVLLSIVIAIGVRSSTKDNKLLRTQKLEIEKRNGELKIANKEIDLKNKEIEKHNDELLIVNEEVENQRLHLEIRTKEITDSIHYAKRLQTAVLPTFSMLDRLLPKSFVIYEPKDIVSGDFYWMEERGDNIFLAVVDCTGHGVPGALVSMVGHNGLHRAIHEFKLTEPAEILDKLNELVEEALYQNDDQEINDGMDLSLICIDKNVNTSLKYAGAYNSLYIIRDSESEVEIIEHKADKQPIGPSSNKKPFTNCEIPLKPGDRFYLFSDGYIDQFGGPKGKKFMSRQFKRLLQDTFAEPIKDQGLVMESVLFEWIGDLEQVDDITVIGVSLS